MNRKVKHCIAFFLSLAVMCSNPVYPGFSLNHGTAGTDNYVYAASDFYSGNTSVSYFTSQL